MSVAFLAVFGAFGLAITAGFRAVIDWIPWIALGIGVLVTALGVAMLFGYELTVSLPKAKRAGKGKGLRSVFGFGLSYGVASLLCTLPVFLSVVATQLTASSFVSGVATFIVYGIGMSMMLVAVTLVMAFGKQSIVTRLRSSARYINRVAGAVLILAGSYIVWFWGTNLSSGAEALGDQGAFTFTETLSQRATEIFGENAGLWGLIFGGLIAAAAGYAFLKRRKGDGDDNLPRSGRRLVAGLAAGVVAIAAIGGFVALNDGRSSPAPTQAALAPRGPAAPLATFDLFDLRIDARILARADSLLPPWRPSTSSMARWLPSPITGASP